ncbi:UNVERIFIED_CONTAM: hypothetical protein K2H54_068199 [Gekko kuhli]
MLVPDVPVDAAQVVAAARLEGGQVVGQDRQADEDVRGSLEDKVGSGPAQQGQCLAHQVGVGVDEASLDQVPMKPGLLLNHRLLPGLGQQPHHEEVPHGLPPNSPPTSAGRGPPPCGSPLPVVTARTPRFVAQFIWRLQCIEDYSAYCNQENGVAKLALAVDLLLDFRLTANQDKIVQ